MSLVQHPIPALLTPPLTKEEFESYEADILKNGQIDDIVTHEGKILDKWHMYQILIKHGKEPRFKPFHANGVATALDFVAAKLKGRNLNSSQKACVSVLFDVEINGNKSSNSRKSSATKAWHQSVRTGEKYQPPHMLRKDLCNLFGASLTLINYASILYVEDKESFNRCLNGENLNQAYLDHRRNNPSKTIAKGGRKNECEKNIVLSKSEISIPSPLESESTVLRFVKQICQHGWKFEIKIEANPNKPGECLYFVHMFGNGFPNQRCGWNGFLPEPFLGRAIVTAAVTRLNKDASSVISE